MARITVQALSAQVEALAATQAQQTEAITALTSVLTRLVEGQHATPAPVADLAQKRASKGTKPLAGAAKAKHEAKVARDAALTPAQVAERDQRKAAEREAYKARKAALSPLNSALYHACGLRDEAWTNRFSNKAALKQALATLTPAQRKAALEALASK